MPLCQREAFGDDCLRFLPRDNVTLMVHSQYMDSVFTSLVPGTSLALSEEIAHPTV